MTLKVIGAGLGRTGTLSLKLALEKLGLGPCYHMAELFVDMSRVPLWIAAADGNADWDAIFSGFTSTTDYPACSFWRELIEYYPDAKVLLTVRDADKWFDSTQSTIFSPEMQARIANSPMREVITKTVWKDFGDRIHDRSFMTASFARHNDEVRRGVPQDRLLEFDVRHGWEPLCAFLGVPVPDTPFPRTNSREEVAALRAEMPPDQVPSPEQMRAMMRERLRKAREAL